MCPWWHLRSLPNLAARAAKQQRDWSTANSGNVVDEIDTETCHTPSIDLVIGDASERNSSILNSYLISVCFFSWWFQPIWNILYSQIGSFPHRGMNTQKQPKTMKPPPSFDIFRQYFGCEAWCQSFGKPWAVAHRQMTTHQDSKKKKTLDPCVRHVWYTGSRGKKNIAYMDPIGHGTKKKHLFQN